MLSPKTIGGYHASSLRTSATIVQKHKEDRLEDAIAYTERLLNQAVALEAQGDKYGAEICLRNAIAAEAGAFNE